MFQRFLYLALVLVLFYGFYIFVDSSLTIPAPVASKNYGVIEHKLNTPLFEAYKNCKWEWKTFGDMGMWIQDCTVNNKKLSLFPDEGGTNLFYGYTTSGTGIKLDTLALQSFGSFSLDEMDDVILDKIYVQLVKSGLLKIESFCNFEKKVSSGGQKVYTLRSQKVNSGTSIDCGEYGPKGQAERYFIIKNTKIDKRFFFINQMQKKLFDVQSLHIYD